MRTPQVPALEGMSPLGLPGKGYNRSDVGCYVDGSRGVYAVDAIVAFAEEHGMDEPESCDCFTHPEWDDLPHWNRCEFASEIEDDCDEYMNSHHGVEGCCWGRSEAGDWGLWEAEAA